MTFARPLISVVAVMTLVCACDRQPEPPPQPVQQPAAAQTPDGPSIAYVCESGRTTTVRYPDAATAQLTYNGQTHAMRMVPAASGVRYAGSGLEWWIRTRNGAEQAILSRLGPDQDVGVGVLERCNRETTGVTSSTQAPGASPAACRAGQLKLGTEGGDAGMGHRVAVMSLQNIGAAPCNLNGYPGVGLLDARGRSLTAVRVEPNPGSYLNAGAPPQPVTVQPQAKAFFDLAWSVVPDEAIGERVCPTVATVRATPPGDTAAVTLAQSFQACGGKVQVGPVRALAGDVARPVAN